ncbi:MAG: hypothetical protein Q9169_000992 [Polycauliona sp. 2 TL-2023]
MAEPAAVHLAQHGTQIFVYNNIRTNQIIYSLTRSLNVGLQLGSFLFLIILTTHSQNHTSLKQLPFLGKKTVPSHLRKDLWQPLCLVSFPRPSQGLQAYRRLREFRRLHETSYPLSLITQTEGPHKGQLHSTKKRGKILMDQKANSVADLAAVLLRAEENLVKIPKKESDVDPKNEVLEREDAKKVWMEKVEASRKDKGLVFDPDKAAEYWKQHELSKTTRIKKVREEKELAAKESKEKRIKYVARMQKAGKKTMMRKDPQPYEEPGVEGVKISWANLLDAEFAEQWPKAVVHDGLSRHRYTAAFPVMEEDVEVPESGEPKEISERIPDDKPEGNVPVELLGTGDKPVIEMRA